MSGDRYDQENFYLLSTYNLNNGKTVPKKGKGEKCELLMLDINMAL